MSPKTAILAALLTLTPAIAWATWPVDVTVALAAGPDQYVNVERSGPLVGVRFTLADGGTRCSAWLTSAEAYDVGNVIAGAAFSGDSSSVVTATFVVTAISQPSFGSLIHVGLTLPGGCHEELAVGDGAEATDIVDALYEAAA